MRLQQRPFTPVDVGGRGGSAQLSPDALEKLRALGYFGFRAAVSPESLQAGLADPKDKLWEFNTILKAEDALQQHDDDQLQRCLELNPNFDNAMTGLARALSKLGRLEEAKGWLQKALLSNPENYR